MHTINIHSSTFNNTLYSIQKRLVFLLCIASALVSASLWSMTASAAAPVALSHSASEQSFALTVTQVNNSPPVVAPSLRIVRTYAGSGVNDFADGSALTAQFNDPSGIARAADGRVFVADSFNNRIRVISADGATVSTYAGDGVESFADGSSSTARFRSPRGIALAADGRLFVAERNHRIRVISADGATVSTYAGSGATPFADGSTSTAAFRFPSGVALAADERLFVADSLNNRIRVISADGATVSTYAGSGSGFADGSTSTARFRSPSGVAVTTDGRVFVADTLNHRIRVISADGATVSTYAGDGVESFADGSTSTAQFDSPTDLVVASDGRVFVADTGNSRIRVISADGAFVSTYAGSGTATQTNEPKELQAALDIDLSEPQRMTLAPDGRLFFTESNGHRIRVIEVISSTSENFGSVTLGAGFQGAGTRVISAQDLFFDAEANDLTFSILSGNEDGLFAIDAASGRVTLAGSLTDTQTGINTLVIQAEDMAGSATVTLTIVVEEVNDPPTFALSSSTANIKQGEDTLQISVTASDDGDSGLDQAITYSISSTNVNFATLTINENGGLITISNVPDAFGREATVSVTATDSSGASSVQSIVIRGYIISRFAQSASVYAGSDSAGTDDGSTTTARFDTPRGLAYAADGRLFVADSANDVIRVIDANGSTVSTYAGSASGSTDTSTTTASFANPFGLALAADGRLFVADSDNNRIRVIDANGSIVSTYAGSGTSGSDDGSTTTASFADPTGLALAADGRLFVSDRGGHIIRVINANASIVSTYAGSGAFSFAIDDSTTTATFSAPRGLALAADGRLFVADSVNNLIRVIDANGSTVSTYAGDIGILSGGFVDGSTATAARFSRPYDVLQAGRTLFVADAFNEAVRVIDASGTVSTLLLENDLGVNLGTPNGLAISTDGRRVFISNNRHQIIVVNTGNTVPTLTLSQNSLSLQSGFSTQTIGVTAADADDNDQVVVSVSGNTLGLLSISTAADSITLSNAGTANGQITLTVSAIDNLGATASERLTVTIGNGGDSSDGGDSGGGGGGCSLQSESGAIDWTLWLLALLSLAALRGYRRFT